MQKLALVSLALSTFVAPWTRVEPTRAPGTGEERPRALAARCLFEDPEFDFERVPLGEWSHVLAHHARCHGWKVERSDVFHEVPFVAPARCPDAALERLARFVDVSDGLEEWEGDVLVALARNGRAEEALDVARKGLAIAIPLEEDMVEWSRPATTACSQVGARVALVAGKFDEALSLTDTWFPTSWCGTCSMGEMGERERVRALALEGTGRWFDTPDEAEWVWMWRSDWYPVQWLLAATRGLAPADARVRAGRIAAERFARYADSPLLETLALLLEPPERVTPREAELLARGAPEVLRQRLVAASAAERQAVCEAMFPEDAPPRIAAATGFLLALGVPELAQFVDRPWWPNDNESDVAHRRARYEGAREIWAVFAGETTPARALRR